MRIPLRLKDASREQKCGDCRACCTVLGISESDSGQDDSTGLAQYKPNWQSCSHECEKGCSIYGKHPDECKEYWCMFSSGTLGKNISYRPDKLGLIFDFRGIEDTDFQFIQAWETRLNASNEKRAQAVIQTFKGKSGLLIRRYQLPLTKIVLYGTHKQQSEILSFMIAQVLLRHQHSDECKSFVDKFSGLADEKLIKKFHSLLTRSGI